MRNICYESTGKCDLKCDYCISADNLKSDREEVPYEEIIKVISEFNPQRIVISGGEPMLDPNLLEKLKMIKQNCPKAFLSISTNGAGKYDYESIMKYIDCIDFSLPALNKQIYAEMRGCDCVEMVKENIQKIKAGHYHCELRLSYTLTKVNKVELPDILEFASGQGIDEFRIGRFFPFRDAALCKAKYELSDEEINDVMNSINSKDYTFRIVPPIADLERMETGYLAINYLGEIFLPTREGKRKLAEVGQLSKAEIEKIETEIEQNNIFINTNIKRKEVETNLHKMLIPIRIRPTHAKYKRSPIEEYYSDRSRILYSQAFRRLQQKAQVFSLETNASVRSRLSHSIEVSDVGRLMAQKITRKLIERPEGYKYHISSEDAEQIVAIVENAGLMHDLGNPPFGHFGEAAIQKWWSENCDRYIKAYNKRAKENNEDAISFTTKRQKEILQDFQEFDGNPQGIRTVLRFNSDEKLEFGDDKESKEQPPLLEYESGMNLTYQTVLSCIKYIRSAGEEYKEGISSKLQKKAGCFQSERHIIHLMQEKLSRSPVRRFPFVYIMEAADDISYCMSDVADSIEKGLTTLNRFVEDLEKIWNEKYNEEIPDTIIDAMKRDEIREGKKKDINTVLTSGWAAKLTEIAADRFVKGIDGFMEGDAVEIFSGAETADESEKAWCRLLEVINEYARRKIYTAAEAESIEIAGYSIIRGLLDTFGKLLTLTRSEFQFLLEPQNNPKDKKLDVEVRYVHLLGKKYIRSYKNQLQEWKKVPHEELSDVQIEWWLRVHMIVDQIAGMTDDYALKTYQLCKGIRVDSMK